MAKVRKQITLDPNVESRLSDEVDNVSRFFNEKAKTWLNMEDAEKRELVEEKREKEDELEDVEEKIEELESKKAEIQGDIHALDQAINDKEEEAKTEKRKMPELVERTEQLRQKYKDREEAINQVKGTEEFHKLKNDLALSSEELQDKLREEVSI